MASTPRLYDYPLARGIIDSVRLNLAHFIWKKEFPWIAHPSIELQGRADLRIADVGCGTGIWLLEAAEEYPEAEGLEGLDIALHQVPAKHLLPGNVNFKRLDLLEEVPEELVGRYDLVHARFLLGIVQNDDPVPLLGKLLKMLKPGGYLQWNEVDWTSESYIGLEENGITKEDSGLYKLTAAGRSRMGPLTWPAKIAEIVEAQDLQNIVVDRRTPDSFPRSFAGYWTEGIVAAAIDGMGKIPEGEMRDHMGKLVEGASEDAKKGIAWAWDHVVVVGQKKG